MIDIANRTTSRISKKLVIQVLTKAAHYLKIKTMDLSVVFINQTAIQKLNKKYRNKNRPTDVLSFAYDFKNNYLDGEITICLPFAKKQALAYNQTINAEITKLLVHSLLHLTGHGHRVKLEQEIIKKIS